MAAPSNLIGFELIVPDLERALALFVDLLGFEVHDRSPSTLVVGEMAVVTDGRVAVTLLEPASDGEGRILPDRTPRLSQIVFANAQPAELLEEMIEAGVATAPTESGFFLAPGSAAGLLGIETAVVITGPVADR